MNRLREQIEARHVFAVKFCLANGLSEAIAQQLEAALTVAWPWLALPDRDALARAVHASWLMPREPEWSDTQVAYAQADVIIAALREQE